MTLPLPKVEDFYVPTARALRALGGSASIEEIQDWLTESEGLTQEQLDQVYPTSGAQIIPDRMSWARSYLKIAGLVESGGRGIWVLTDDGRQAVDTLNDAALRRLVMDAGNAHNAMLVAHKKAKQAAALASPGKKPTEGLVYEGSSGTDDSGWTETLLQVLRTMDPAAFERLAQRLLRESGFVKVEVTGKSGDGGIDGSGVLRMNLISFQVLFQCKRYQGSVGAGTVRDFRGAMQGRADKGLIITTANFTSDARKEATRDGAPSIDLIDGDALCELLKEKELGVRVRPVVTEEVTILPEFFDEI
ncbi:MAG: restriction endonuclease [Sphingomonas sp.]|nr:restriction endonuclease [Sphingomonas sp.]